MFRPEALPEDPPVLRGILRALVPEDCCCSACRFDLRFLILAASSIPVVTFVGGGVGASGISMGAGAGGAGGGSGSGCGSGIEGIEGAPPHIINSPILL